MKTRQQYLNQECTHSEYYGQFVTEGIKNIVRERFGEDALKEAYQKNEHFNNVPLSNWDGLEQHIRSVAPKVKEAGDYLTQAVAVCILKEAARQIVNE